MTLPEDEGQHSSGPSSRPRLRLLKAVVQLVFVEDDGHTLTERVTDPVVVPAHLWPTWAAEEYPALLEQLQDDLDGGGPTAG